MKPSLRHSLLAAAALAGIVSTSARAELMYGSNAFQDPNTFQVVSTISRFDSANPSALTTVTVTGLQANESIVGIDLRPSNGLLYGIGTSNRIYTINPITGAATAVGSSGQFTLNGTAFGTDFNPVPDRIRQVSNTEQNLRLNPNDGTGMVDGALNPAGNVVAVAYSNNFAGAASTVLYAIDSAAGTLGIVSNPNMGGPITVVGSLGLGTNLLQAIGFDISGLTGVAYANIATGGINRLYTINLSTGAATPVGTIGNGSQFFTGLTAATAVPEPSTYALLGAGALLFALRKRLRRARS